MADVFERPTPEQLADPEWLEVEFERRGRAAIDTLRRYAPDIYLKTVARILADDD